MRPDNISVEIEIPQDVNVNIENGLLTVKGKAGEVKRNFTHSLVKVTKDSNKLLITTERPTKKEKAMVFTYKAHINNMIKGVTEPFKYELKICSTHFPMSVKFGNNELVVSNFYGEKHPRKLKVPSDIKLTVNDKIIEIESPNKELAGLVANNIEQLTRISNKDLRIFQDGIYIISKGGKQIK